MHTIRPARETDLPKILELIHHTIKVCYPEIYRPKVIGYFLNYHNPTEIARRMREEILLVLEESDIIKATGFIVSDELGGVYVDPSCQRRGMGTAVVNRLLELAKKNKIERLVLHSTPTAKHMYDKLGFTVVYKKIEYIGDEPLEYYRMEYLM